MAEPTYTDAQAAKLLEQLNCFAMARSLTQARLAGLLGIAGSSLSSLMGGKYAGDLDGHLTKIEQFLDRETERAEKPSITRFVETSVSKSIFTVLKQNHIYGTMGAVIGGSGVGKTRAFQEYAARNENVLFLTASSWLRSPGALAKKLASAVLTEKSSHKLTERCEALVVKLLGASRLIIIDQAHQISERGFEFLQNLWDQCNPADDERRLGIVIGATSRFWTDIQSSRGLYWFEQLTSRLDAGTNKQIGHAPFRMSDIDALFSRENLQFELTDAARTFLLNVANKPNAGGLRSAVANVDHLQHLLIKSKATNAKITADNLKQTQELMLRSAA